MLKKIIATIGTRYLIAILNLLLIPINARILGAEGMGLVALIYALANIALSFNSILSGSTIVYFMNRYDFRYVFWPAYIWSFIGSAIAWFIMASLNLMPKGYEFEIYMLSVLLSLVAINSRILLGKDKIKIFNLTFMLQAGLLFFILLFFYYWVGKKDSEAYIWGLFITNSIAWIISLLFIIPFFRQIFTFPHPSSIFKLISQMFKYGLWGSADNLAENLTSRLNYILLQRFVGYGQVGILDAGTKISESVWHISRSVSFISYSQTAKTIDPEIQKKQTLGFFKLTYCALTVVIFVILLIPEWVFTDYLFSKEFMGITRVIQSLSVGIIAFGSNSILSHYFIGTGKVKFSTMCSFLGLIVLLITGYFFIPVYQVIGAAISSSISFSIMLIFSLIIFMRLTGTSLRELLPVRDDIRHVKHLIFNNKIKL